MTNTQTPIVERTLLAQEADGREWPMTIRLWAPTQSDQMPWACVLEVTELFSPAKPIYGEDSWRALQLALRFTASLLEGFRSKAGRIYWPYDEGEGQRFELEPHELLPRLPA